MTEITCSNCIKVRMGETTEPCLCTVDMSFCDDCIEEVLENRGCPICSVCFFKKKGSYLPMDINSYLSILNCKK